MLNVLHLASFHGNLGDAVSHRGTRRVFRSVFGEVEFTAEEIRNYYQNARPQRQFDDGFINRANAHDLLLVGGGNFFELAWPTRTGTTIDMPPEVLEAINVPIVFYGLGCDPHRGAPAPHIERFKEFLDYTSRSAKCFVSARNDGSIEHVRQLCGQHYADLLSVVPDGGFLTGAKPGAGRDYIAVCVAQDKLSASTTKLLLRFIGEELHHISLRHPELGFVFIPHVPGDFGAIEQVIMASELNSNKTFVGSLGFDDNSIDEALGLYSHAEAVVSMRLHGVIIPDSMGIASYSGFGIPKIHDAFGIPTPHSKASDIEFRKGSLATAMELALDMRYYSFDIAESVQDKAFDQAQRFFAASLQQVFTEAE